MTEEMREVRLPADLCAAAEKRFDKTFANVEELLTAVLRDLATDDVSAWIRRNSDWWNNDSASLAISETSP